MSEPITPRGFEPRSLKNSLGRRATPPPNPTPPSQTSPSQTSPSTPPVDVTLAAAATTAREPARTAAERVVGERAADETAPLPTAEAATARPPRVAARQPSRSSASKTKQAAQREPAAPQAPEAASPAGARARPRAPRGQIVFYLPIELSRQLRAAAYQQSKTHADVIFDAIESRLDELDALLHEEEAASRAAGVFTRNEARPAEPKVQVSGQIRADNLMVIDRLVEQHGADSRSQLVEVALRAHLDSFDAPSR